MLVGTKASQKAPQNSDWVIPTDPGEPLLLVTATGEAVQAEDFVIGDELIDSPQESKSESLAEILFEDFPFEAPNVTPAVPVSGQSDSAWREIAKNDAARIVPEFEPAVVEGKSAAAAMLELQNHCRSLISEAKQWLSQSEAGGLSEKQRNIIQGNVETHLKWLNTNGEDIRVQLNHCILKGDIEQMRLINSAKVAVSDALTQWRKLAQIVGAVAAVGVAPAMGQVEVRQQTTVDLPDLSRSNYFKQTPAQAKAKAATKAVAAKGRTSKNTWASPLAKAVLIIGLFMIVPLAYYASLRSTMPKRTDIEVAPFQKIIPLKRAYEVKGNLIGEVEVEWQKVSRPERDKAFRDFVLVTKDHNYPMVVLYYTDGQPAANFAMGTYLIHEPMTAEQLSHAGLGVH